jgi:hypothetical protein
MQNFERFSVTVYDPAVMEILAATDVRKFPHR